MKKFDLKHYGRRTVLMIVLGGLMTALEIVMERNLSIIDTNTTRISPAFIARAISGSLFGPAFSALIGFMADYIGATIIYGSANPFLSITAILRGFFYGLFLKGKINLKRTVAAVLCVEVFCSLLVNSVILHFMYHNDLKATMLTRLPQVGIYIAVQIPMILAMGRYLIPQLRRIITGYGDDSAAKKLVDSVVTAGSKPGLERVKVFSRLLGSPENDLRIIHVAGTNGKGSVSNMLACILKETGLKVGIFNSPYLQSPREYFNINGKLMDEAEFAELTAKLTAVVKDNADGELPEAPTEFEFYTCGAIKYFADKKCDVVILEAGMGGRLDATNFISAPELAVITNIGIDHEAYLGKTIEEIAGHKAGIIKPGCTAVLYPSEDAALDVLKAECESRAVSFIIPDLSKLDTYQVFGNSYSTVVNYKTCRDEKYEVVLRTPAVYQVNNAALVLECVSALKDRGFLINEEAVTKGLEKFALPARFEIISNEPLIIADGGHNPQCAKAVAETMKLIANGKRVVVLTAVMKDKDYPGLYDHIDSIADEYVTVTAGNPRSLTAKELADFLEKYGKPVTAAQSIEEGVAIAKEKAKDECLLITGSFYMMDAVRKELKA